MCVRLADGGERAMPKEWTAEGKSPKGGGQMMTTEEDVVIRIEEQESKKAVS